MSWEQAPTDPGEFPATQEWGLIRPGTGAVQPAEVRLTTKGGKGHAESIRSGRNAGGSDVEQSGMRTKARRHLPVARAFGEAE